MAPLLDGRRGEVWRGTLFDREEIRSELVSFSVSVAAIARDQPGQAEEVVGDLESVEGHPVASIVS